VRSRSWRIAHQGPAHPEVVQLPPHPTSSRQGHRRRHRPVKSQEGVISEGGFARPGRDKGAEGQGAFEELEEAGRRSMASSIATRPSATPLPTTASSALLRSSRPRSTASLVPVATKGRRVKVRSRSWRKLVAVWKVGGKGGQGHRLWPRRLLQGPRRRLCRPRPRRHFSEAVDRDLASLWSSAWTYSRVSEAGGRARHAATKPIG
jgi:hypothetical protein